MASFASHSAGKGIPRSFSPRWLRYHGRLRRRPTADNVSRFWPSAIASRTASQSRSRCVQVIADTSLVEWTSVIGVILLTPSIIGTWGLQILFPELMLVPLVAGDAAANRTEHSVMGHMACQRAGRGSGETSKSMGRWRSCTPRQQDSGSENYRPHGFRSAHFANGCFWKSVTSPPALRRSDLPPLVKA